MEACSVVAKLDAQGLARLVWRNLSVMQRSLSSTSNTFELTRPTSVVDITNLIVAKSEQIPAARFQSHVDKSGVCSRLMPVVEERDAEHTGPVNRLSCRKSAAFPFTLLLTVM